MNQRTIAAVLILCLLLSACGSLTQPSLKEDLVQSVKRLQSGEGSGLMRMNYVTTFDWDRMYVFQPYTSAKEIRKKLGFDWAKAEETGIENSDTHQLVVFVQGDDVVRYVKVPRKAGTFSVKKGLTPGNAVFQSVEEDGQSVIKPVGEIQ
ncbi:hypothetical protein [Paludifilum halophilum]|uniref:Lipoprotein n=1 Tax=Paludifilum halophilum TaxID=1642702 RepID=A0A235B9S5_9BACL|nr:hypothetical protein [Paludifilum halophilum]OYD08982.1 hypothetical protein CHM34_04185 [Paludifilum halophilum]